MADEMTLDRLGALLDAYGARPERWPDAERPAALALLFASREARARRDAAAALDAMLDRAPALAPSPELADRILAGAPRGVRPASRPQRRRVPVARRRWGSPRRRAWRCGWCAAARFRPALDPAAVAQLDDYETPTDALLASTDLDNDDALPVFGCDDPDVDCDDADVPPGRPTAARPAWPGGDPGVTRRTIRLAAVAIALSCAAAKAGPMGQRRGPAFLRQLFPPSLIMRQQGDIGLTAAQREAITKEMAEAQKAMLDVRWQLEEKTAALDKLLAAEKIDEAAALAQADEVVKLEDRMKRIRLGMMIRVKNLLTPAAAGGAAEGPGRGAPRAARRTRRRRSGRARGALAALAARARIEHVAHAVAEQVDGEDQAEQRHRGGAEVPPHDRDRVPARRAPDRSSVPSCRRAPARATTGRPRTARARRT